jgi:hypothetical protein
MNWMPFRVVVVALHTGAIYTGAAVFPAHTASAVTALGGAAAAAGTVMTGAGGVDGPRQRCHVAC